MTTFWCFHDISCFRYFDFGPTVTPRFSQLLFIDWKTQLQVDPAPRGCEAGRGRRQHPQEVGPRRGGQARGDEGLTGREACLPRSIRPGGDLRRIPHLDMEREALLVKLPCEGTTTLWRFEVDVYSSFSVPSTTERPPSDISPSHLQVTIRFRVFSNLK